MYNLFALGDFLFYIFMNDIFGEVHIFNKEDTAQF
jgi:hypothetical protein